MKTLKPTTPTSTAQKAIGQPRQTQMETALIPQLLDPQILFTLSRGSSAYRWPTGWNYFCPINMAMTNLDNRPMYIDIIFTHTFERCILYWEARNSSSYRKLISLNSYHLPPKLIHLSSAKCSQRVLTLYLLYAYFSGVSNVICTEGDYGW